MVITPDATTFDRNEIDVALTAGRNALNGLLMALEGMGKHALDPKDELEALNELALAGRNALADLAKTLGYET